MRRSCQGGRGADDERRFDRQRKEPIFPNQKLMSMRPNASHLFLQFYFGVACDKYVIFGSGGLCATITLTGVTT